jgi:hypothetical protein
MESGTSVRDTVPWPMAVDRGTIFSGLSKSGFRLEDEAGAPGLAVASTA